MYNLKKKVSIWKCINLNIVKNKLHVCIDLLQNCRYWMFFSEGNSMAHNSHIPIYACQFEVKMSCTQINTGSQENR